MKIYVLIAFNTFYIFFLFHTKPQLFIYVYVTSWVEMALWSITCPKEHLWLFHVYLFKYTFLSKCHISVTLDMDWGNVSCLRDENIEKKTSHFISICSIKEPHNMIIDFAHLHCYICFFSPIKQFVANKRKYMFRYSQFI